MNFFNSKGSRSLGWISYGWVNLQILAWMMIGATLLMAISKTLNPESYTKGLSFIFFTLVVAGIYGGLRARFENTGQAIVLSFLFLISLSYIPYFTARLAISLLLLAWLAYATFRRHQSIKAHLRISLAAFIIGAMFALFLIESLSANMADPLIEHEVRQLSLNPDTLFHATLSEMFKEYGRPSTGMHGLALQHYHLFSHFLYGRMAILLNLPAFQVYGFASILVFGPLLIFFLLEVMREFAGGWRTGTAFWASCIFAAAVFCLPFSTLWNSHFISESYLIGLILLLAFISLLRSTLHSIRFSHLVLMPVCLFMMFAAKISVGFIAFGVAGLFLLHNIRLFSLRTLSLGFLLLAAAFTGYLVSRIVPMPGLEVRFQLLFFQNALFPDWSVLQFMLTHFYLSLAALAAATIRYWDRSFRKIDQIFALSLIFGLLVGIAALNMTIDSSGYYFSNVASFIAAVYFSFLTRNLPHSFNFRNKYRLSTAFLLFVSSLFLLLILIFPTSQFKKGWRKVKTLGTEISANQYRSPYIPLLEKIHRDPEKKFLVYIPKSEVDFWNNTADRLSPWKHQQCIRMPFYIPLISGRPALFGLPLIEGSKTECYLFFRGFESYTQETYKRSQRTEHSPEELCNETKILGFAGYFRVVSTGYQKIRCDAQER